METSSVSLDLGNAKPVLSAAASAMQQKRRSLGGGVAVQDETQSFPMKVDGSRAAKDAMNSTRSGVGAVSGAEWFANLVAEGQLYTAPTKNDQ